MPGGCADCGGMYRNKFSFFWKVFVRMALSGERKMVKSRKLTDEERGSVFQWSLVMEFKSEVKSL